ncbi:PDZ/DHR/GLGF domain protein, partial [Cooperia oncophora]
RPLATSETARKLPQRPTASNTAARNIKTYRVRFADEVDSGASTSSTCSEQSTKSASRCATAIRQRQQLSSLDTPQATSPYVTQMTRPKKTTSTPSTHAYMKQPDNCITTARKPSHAVQYSYSIDDVESLPEPPSYEVAISRLRQFEKPRESIRDFVIRQNVNEALSRKLRNRSASLPRLETADLNELQYRSPPKTLNYQMDQLRNLAIGSLDNLSVSVDSPNKNTLRRRRLPVAPLLGSLSKIPGVQPDDFDFAPHSSRMMQRRSRDQAEMQRFARRSASIGPHCEVLEYGTRREIPPVRAVLVALDQCGFRTVVVEKTQPGPFGFYIATGVMNGQRGIFISRVSIASLSPMLSVGDEILYVDDQLVKGRSLETVQALIAGKTKVLIVLLPAIGKYIY